MLKLSATIITLNEEKNIADCLASLSFVDEIVVVDSGSSDRTEEICRSLPAVRFFNHPWQGYGLQKNFAANLAGNDWILNIDADERVTPELRDSIAGADLTGFPAFRMARENYFGTRRIRRCGWYPDYNVRLYDRRSCRFKERAVHESLEHDGNIGTLAGNLRHFTYTGISDYVRRMDRYSTLAAQELIKAGVSPTILHIAFKPPATFVKMYILRGGFLEGYAGFLLSCLYACYTLCKYAKGRELARNCSELGP